MIFVVLLRNNLKLITVGVCGDTTFGHPTDETY